MSGIIVCCANNIAGFDRAREGLSYELLSNKYNINDV